MSVLTGLFNVFALLYIGRAIMLALTIARDWTHVRQEPLTRAKQSLAEQAAFFIGVPVAVLIHEFFHAIFVWLFGGRVVEFGYRVFWGYVLPAGDFTPAQDWAIAVAGTIGSLLTGAAFWFFLRNNASRTLRYFGLRTFRFQIYFSLIYYPIFSFFLPIGDWRTIYDFGATPLLSGLAAVMQATALWSFWRADRRGWFEMPGFESLGEQARFDATQRSAEAGDRQAQLRHVDDLRRAGAPNRARAALTQYMTAYPNSAEGYLELAALIAAGRGGISREAADAARRAIDLGLSDANQFAQAHRLRAMFHLERGDGPAAQAEIDTAFAHVNGAGTFDTRVQAELLAIRGQALRRQGRYDEAAADVQSAIELAHSSGDAGSAARFSAELDVIEKNDVRRLPIPADRERST